MWKLLCVISANSDVMRMAAAKEERKRKKRESNEENEMKESEKAKIMKKMTKKAMIMEKRNMCINNVEEK